MDDLFPIAPPEEIGSLGVYHLKRLWSAALLARSNPKARIERNAHLDRLVLDALGVSLQQAFQYLFIHTPTFPEFEQWVVTTAGRPKRSCIDRLNSDISGTARPKPIIQWLDTIEKSEPVLTQDDLLFWEKNGYVILKNAVHSKGHTEAEKAIWNYVDADPNVTESWYQKTNSGIMIELIQHPAIEANRRSARIHKAFAQIWGTADLWVSSDRCGFHPPQRENHPFPGPDLHWDIDFSKPTNFGTQGILYLTDTPPEQGALTLVPGFHHRLPDWLKTLGPSTDPNQQDLHALGSVPIGAQAGDMIIWNQNLPHGSCPNLGARPRIVQYINMYPGRELL